MVGSAQPRVEDARLLSGQGCFVDDLYVPGLKHAAFVRSSLAHARIVSVDVEQARRLPGVVGVLTGADLVRLTNAFAGPLVMKHLVHPTFYALATELVRHVGDPIAIVVAQSRAIAEDACEQVVVDYEPLVALADTASAMASGAPQVWPAVRGNILRHAIDDSGDVDGAFRKADRVVTERFDLHRQANQPMETRGIVAEWDERTARMIVHSNTQNSHLLKWVLAMLTNRSSSGSWARAACREPARLRAVARGARKFARTRPGLGAVAKTSMPILARQAAVNPGWLRELVRAAGALVVLPAHAVPEVRTYDIGGAFGCKSVVPREDVAVVVAAREFGCSVKWMEDRNEHLIVGGHARDESAVVEMAITNDGTILGAKVRLVIDAGAYPAHPFGPPVFAKIAQTIFPGPYRIGALRFETTIVATNKATYVAYRGPWAVETFVRERMVDLVARTVGRPAYDVRQANMYGVEELPVEMVTGPVLDVRMSARATLERAVVLADVAAWPDIQRAAQAENRLVGLGFATFIEPAPGPPGFLDHIAAGFSSMTGPEPVVVTLDDEGCFGIRTQQVPHGQGHETTLAQVAADQLGVPIESVRVYFGDTRITPFSLLGTSGSRGAARAGGAVYQGAAEMRRRIHSIAAELLAVAPDQVTMTDGRLGAAARPDRTVTLAQVAAEARRRGWGQGAAALRLRSSWDGGPGGWAQATHACWVEIDRDIGAVQISRYVVVEDSGTLINPAIVDGQIRGGVAQGIGAVFFERTIYDEAAQIQSGTFAQYLLPTSSEIPDLEIHHLQTPTDVVANYRGAGEGGMICAPAAITNAIEDALAHLGVRITEQHLPPTRILQLTSALPAPARLKDLPAVPSRAGGAWGRTIRTGACASRLRRPRAWFR